MRGLVEEHRNCLVHEKTHPYKNLAVPTIETVDMLEGIAQQFTNPARAIPTFRKAVETVETSTSLASVLRTIAKRDFSQFPVYESGAFRGLLTENGITRWLSHHVTTELSLVELDEVTVS